MPDLGRAGEGEHPHGLVAGEHGSDSDRVAVHDVEHARRQPGAGPSSASASALSGVSLAGFSTTVQPAASAGATLRAIIRAGKFHGVIAATTPTGWRRPKSRRLLRLDGDHLAVPSRASSAKNRMKAAL